MTNYLRNQLHEGHVVVTLVPKMPAVVFWSLVLCLLFEYFVSGDPIQIQ